LGLARDRVQARLVTSGSTVARFRAALARRASRGLRGAAVHHGRTHRAVGVAWTFRPSPALTVMRVSVTAQDGNTGRGITALEGRYSGQLVKNMQVSPFPARKAGKWCHMTVFRS